MRTVSIVIVHPSRLLAEGLSRILHGSRFRVKWFASYPRVSPPKYFRDDRTMLFIVGSRSSALASASIAEIHRLLPLAVVVAIGDSDEVEAISSALRAGASGYLQEAMSSEALLHALNLVLSGETIVPAKFLQQLPSDATVSRPTRNTPHDSVSTKPIAQQQMAQDPDPDCVPTTVQPAFQATEHTKLEEEPDSTSEGTDAEGTLTSRALSFREGEILQCLVRGSSNKEIARSLAMAEATVKVHLKTILRKIRVKNRTQAAIWAVQNLRNGFENGASVHN